MTASTGLKLRESAAVVLVRRRGESLEAFWVLRSDAVLFMPGFRAFVGGSVDRTDGAIEIEGEMREAAQAVYACAIRETFEETGVLVALAGPVDSAPLPEARRRLLAGEATFSDLARSHGWRFRADGLAFAGRWTTPPFAASRFDTCYFVAWAPEEQEPEVQAGELASGEWIAPSAALERWRAGEVTFAAPILYTLLELARGEEDLAARLATAPERVAQPVRRIELKWGIVLQPMKTRPLPPATHTNAYLVGEREMALIDPGSDDPEELAALFELIEMLRADGRELKLVIATHHHRDHVAGIAAVRERYDVPVAAHPDTARHVGADRMLDDGVEIRLASDARDWTLRAIHTPGHARGHVCLFHARTGSLFTGDHLIGGTGTVIIDPPEGDMTAYIDSLERLRELPIQTLFPGHGSPQGAARRRIEWILHHRREREAKVLAALESTPRSLAELVEAAYADTPREMWAYAERSLLAHLIRLEGGGTAVREGERWRKAGSS